MISLKKANLELLEHILLFLLIVAVIVLLHSSFNRQSGNTAINDSELASTTDYEKVTENTTLKSSTPYAASQL